MWQAASLERDGTLDALVERAETRLVGGQGRRARGAFAVGPRRFQSHALFAEQAQSAGRHVVRRADGQGRARHQQRDLRGVFLGERATHRASLRQRAPARESRESAADACKIGAVERAAHFWLSIPLFGLLACGGRYASTRHDEPSSSAGSSSSSAGTSSTSTAGSSSAGTSPICACESPGCSPGYVEVPNDGGCCSHCELDQIACQQENADYLSYRADLIAQFSSFGCMQASDCVAFYIQNACDHSCLLTVTGARRAVIDGLNNYAIGNCREACFQSPKPDCGEPPPPVCASGHCAVIK